MISKLKYLPIHTESVPKKDVQKDIHRIILGSRI